MKTASQLMDEGVNSIQLSILVFGPQVDKLANDPRTRALQKKRGEIRETLENLGHHVKYTEDIVDPNLHSPANNALLQEIAIMREYDCIITLVGSPGSISEAAVISTNPDFARKASLYLDEDYIDGFVAETCRLAETLGADFRTYKYPEDLIDCNLLGFVKQKIGAIQTLKFMS